MSVLMPGDERWHYSDGSHRWACPDPDGGQEAWAAQVRVHVERHSEGHDTPANMMPVLASAADLRRTSKRPARN